MVPGARSFGGLFFAIIFLEKFLQIIIFSNNFSRFFSRLVVFYAFRLLKNNKKCVLE